MYVKKYNIYIYTHVLSVSRHLSTSKAALAFMQYTWDCSDVFPYESKGRCISCKHTRAALSTHGLHFVNVMIKSNSDMPIIIGAGAGGLCTVDGRTLG